jgi:hypothetical protein
VHSGEFIVCRGDVKARLSCRTVSDGDVALTCRTSGVQDEFDHAFEQRGLRELLPFCGSSKRRFCRLRHTTLHDCFGCHEEHRMTAAAASLSCVSLRIRANPDALLREAVDGSVRIIALRDALALPPLSLLNIDSVRTTELAMSTDAILTSKGQTTIRKKIRDAVHMKAGGRISFT